MDKLIEHNSTVNDSSSNSDDSDLLEVDKLGFVGVRRHSLHKSQKSIDLNGFVELPKPRIKIKEDESEYQDMIFFSENNNPDSYSGKYKMYSNDTISNSKKQSKVSADNLEVSGSILQQTKMSV